MLLKQIETFFADIILRDQSNTSHAVSHLEFFFQKTTACHVLAAKSLSLREKWTGNNYVVKILLTNVQFKI